MVHVCCNNVCESQPTFKLHATSPVKTFPNPKILFFHGHQKVLFIFYLSMVPLESTPEVLKYALFFVEQFLCFDNRFRTFVLVKCLCYILSDRIQNLFTSVKEGFVIRVFLKWILYKITTLLPQVKFHLYNHLGVTGFAKAEYCVSW